MNKMRLNLLNSTGQSTMEYVIVLTMVVLALLIIVPKTLLPHVNQIYNTAGNKMDESFVGLEKNVGFNTTGTDR